MVGCISWLLPDGSSVPVERGLKSVLFKMGASECERSEGTRERPLTERCTAQLHADGTCTLEVSECRVSDSGVYTCLVKTEKDPPSSSAARLIVMGNMLHFSFTL